MAQEKIFGYMGDLKEGKYVIIDDHPCKIMSIDKAKTGKHGAAKVSAVGISIFDGSKHNLAKPSDADVEIPIVERKRSQVVSISGNVAQVMDLTTFETFEVAIPEDMAKDIESGKEVQYVNVLGRVMLLRT